MLRLNMKFIRIINIYVSCDMQNIYICICRIIYYTWTFPGAATMCALQSHPPTQRGASGSRRTSDSQWRRLRSRDCNVSNLMPRAGERRRQRAAAAGGTSASSATCALKPLAFMMSVALQQSVITNGRRAARSAAPWRGEKRQIGGRGGAEVGADLSRDQSSGTQARLVHRQHLPSAAS